MCCFLNRNLIDADAILSVNVGTGLVQFEADERQVGEGSKVVVVKTTAVVCKIKAENGAGELRDPFLSEMSFALYYTRCRPFVVQRGLRLGLQ